jgi:lipoprotein NlpI
MMRFSFLVPFSLSVFAVLMVCQVRADEVDDLLRDAQDLFKKGKQEEAVAMATKAIKTDPKNIKGYFFRATLYTIQRQPDKAIADYTKIIELQPKLAQAYDLRGSEHFKLGHVNDAIADFDKFIELKPKEKNGHWRRGIAYYYAGRYKEGRDQFKGYEAVDTNDVENAVWHFLCVARDSDLATARKSMLKIGKDPRVPLMQVYELFLGKAKPEEVLAAANKVAKDAKPGLLGHQLFYAHLYLGLYYDVRGDKKKALEHMTRAAKDYANNGYMGEVARVHLRFLQKEGSSK